MRHDCIYNTIVADVPPCIQFYFSQKQLPRKMKSRLVITKYTGYILWQMFFAATVNIILRHQTAYMKRAPLRVLGKKTVRISKNYGISTT